MQKRKKQTFFTTKWWKNGSLFGYVQKNVYLYPQISKNKQWYSPWDLNNVYVNVFCNNYIILLHPMEDHLP